MSKAKQKSALDMECSINEFRNQCSAFMGNRWRNSRNSVRLYFFGLKITADGDCSHEIKRRFLLGRKVMINLDSILKAETLFCQQRSI